MEETSNPVRMKQRQRLAFWSKWYCLFIGIILCQNPAFSGSFGKVSGGFKSAPVMEAPIDPQLAGGGVVLTAVAIPSHQTSGSKLHFVLKRNMNHFAMQAVQGTNIYVLNTPDWLLKRAILVAASPYTRMVTLLNPVDTNVVRALQLDWFECSQLFWVGMHPDLIGTKVGEALLLIDLIYVDPLRFSQHEFPNFQKDIKALKLDRPAIQQFQDQAEEIERYAVVRLSNWTWADSDGSYNLNFSRGKIQITGGPEYWMLSQGTNGLVLNSAHTEFCRTNRVQMIRIIPEAFAIGVNYARALALCRFIARHDPAGWVQICNTAPSLPDEPGETPAFVPQSRLIEELLLRRDLTGK